MRSVFCVLMCLFLFGDVGAVKVVNSRNVPEKEDFSSFGDAYQFNMYDTILTEMLPIMPSGRNGDGIDVDSIRGNPDIDSISGNIVQTGGLESDSLKLGTAWVTDVYMIDDTNDTLVVKQGGKTWKFDVLADQ